MPETAFKLEYSVDGYDKDGVTAVIVAGGSSSRMGGTDKMLADLDGRCVLWHTVNAFENHPDIAAIIVVASESNMNAVQNACEGFSKITDITLGGKDRAHSAKNGFSLVRTKYVLVQDGARPLVTKEVIDRVIAGLRSSDACAAAVPVKDTVKRVDSNGYVVETLCRDTLVAMQTPQGFLSSVYKTALETAEDISAFTDDCALVESAGVTVKCVKGDHANIKITTAEDLILARALLKGE